VNVLDRCDELLELIRAAAAASDLEDKELITISDDGHDAETALSPSAGAIIVYATPAETRPGPKTSRLTWTIAVTSDGEKARDVATRLQELLGLLRTAGVFRAEDTATPTDFTKTDRSTIPGYTITHIEEHRS
jgi:hypothetical protein